MSEPTVASLVPVEVGSSLVRPAGTIREIEQAFADYQTLCQRLLDAGDYQRIGDREFRKKSAWRKLALAFGVSFQHVSHVYERDEAGKLVRVEFIYRAVAPSGRYAEAFGAAHASELTGARARTANPEHDLPATAETRAKNRAASDLFGMGEVSAEEITGGDQGPPGRTDRDPPPGVDRDGVIEGDRAREWADEEMLNDLMPTLRSLEGKALLEFRASLSARGIPQEAAAWNRSHLRQVTQLVADMGLRRA